MEDKFSVECFLFLCSPWICFASSKPPLSVHAFLSPNFVSCRQLCFAQFSQRSASPILPKPKPFGDFPFQRSNLRRRNNKFLTNGGKRSNLSAQQNNENKASEVEQEEEVECSWVDERVEDVVQYASTVVRAIPGPRVGDGEMPWLLALPVGYMALTFIIAIVKTVRNYNAPKSRRRRQIGKNSWLVESLGEYLPAKREELDSKTLKHLGQKCQFDTAEVLRKYIRYALNERPFDPELVADLIHLRRVSLLDDKSVAEILNEVSRRIVKSKGPVVVDTTGFTEKGLKRKVAVQALFSKILYLSELDEFCSTSDRSSLSIKEIFGVTESSEIESLENLVGSSNDDEMDEEEK